jgi:hypothetical protein
VRDRLTARGFPSPTAARIDFRAPTTSVPARAGHDAVGVFVRDIRALAPAAAAVRTTGFQATEGVIPQLTAYAEATEAGAAVLRKLLWAVWGMAAVGLLALALLRAWPKASEVGMLRAAGAGPLTLTNIFLLETVYLWLAGVAVGIVAAAIVWRAAAPDTPLPEIVTPEWQVRGGVFLLGVLAWVGLWTLSGVLPAVVRSPARALHS